MTIIEITKDFPYYPDDDGERTMVWITDFRERERAGCKKVAEVLARRPWVQGEVFFTETNSEDDVKGIDVIIEVKEGLQEMLGIAGLGERVIGLQIKSSAKAVKDFLKKKKMIKHNRFVFEDGVYMITVNGTDAKQLILADIVGQMIALAMKSGSVKSEQEFLAFLNEWMGDREAVEAWYEQREVILDSAWYADLI